MGIPLITNSGVGDVEEVVKKYNGGFVINDFSDEAFNAVIKQVAADKIFDRQNIRNGAIDFYALETAVERYRKLYENILGK